MTVELRNRPGFWRVVRLLLSAARKRATGRQKRQQELFRERSGKNSTNWSGLGFAFTVFFMLILNVMAAFVVRLAVDYGERLEVERQGKIVVSRAFLSAVESASENFRISPGTTDRQLDESYYSSEAKDIAENHGGTPAVIEQKLRNAVRDHGPSAFVARDQLPEGLAAIREVGGFPAMLGSAAVVWWGVMLVFQGEGLELDLQRRRHPMWEWLFTHPVPSGAIFLAEMLSPIAANPMYWSAPLFVGVLYGLVYDPATGILATLLIGIPVAIAAACLGKALEIAVILRFSARTRGAIVGLMGWLGYASMMLLLLGLFILPKVVNVLGRFLTPLVAIPWPWLRLFLGARTDGSFSFLAGMFACWVVAGVTLGSAVWFSVWGAQQGLSGSFSAADSGPAASRKGDLHFGKDPLYRKEFLWFIRDRSAIVQTILIPLTIAAMQAFNMRFFLSYAQGAWNYLCGAAILFGTYFLWVLGPKSLSSEGSALWIAMTWPRGLESLLKAKAWLWSLISTSIVALVLCYAAFLFPASIWKILLVGVGWFVFSRSMAEKAVTLVTVTTSSGETEKIPAGRRWAAQLGMLTFAIGVLSQQWNIAIVGIVYSYLTAAAMWENFRARLPYLYDPWSEKLPAPPTLMHAMVAISVLVEGGAVITGIVIAFAGRENIAVAQAIAYGFSAVAVSIGVWSFLSDREVSLRDVWCWGTTRQGQPKQWWLSTGARDGGFLLLLLFGAAGGLLLGLFAHGYEAILQHVPGVAEIVRKSQEQIAQVPNLKISYAVMAVVFAPFAEEYLFRGLLFRALDREWGGWRAVIGSAAFFAIYHPALSWLPVGLLGVANALLFKKTGRLAPAVVLHMVYNAVVLS
jgi:membrane protease YdiL (CAAX protease family)